MTIAGESALTSFVAADGARASPPPTGADQHIDVAEGVDLLLGELAVEPADADDADVVDLHTHDGPAAAHVHHLAP